ncbi:MAG: efflux RND transporter periplasmic adaptor subunit [Endomicrobium sp.]|jgi:HlyD family secretion protein|nr:efflux RND transporter periplasmic adaptor subunit [Endomicrobium sp.]
MKFINLFLALALSAGFFSCGGDKNIIAGEIDASEIDVGVKVPGRIAEIFVDEGENVKKGQILGRLEGKELDAKLKTVDAALKEAQEQFSLAQKTFERIKNLYESGVVPKQQFDETEYKYAAARQKAAAVKGQKDEVLAYYEELTLTAPIDGEIVQIISNVGELVSAGYPIITILNPSDKWAVFNIREDKLADVKKGAAYKVFIPALNADYEMKVAYIAPLGSFASWKPAAHGGNYDLKTFEVRLKSKEQIEDLRPGMTAIIDGIK